MRTSRIALLPRVHCSSVQTILAGGDAFRLQDDEEVPFGHAERIRKACPKATFWKLEGYERVGAYAYPDYQERLLNFLRTSEAQESTH